MLQHARMTLGFVYELASHTFGPATIPEQEL